MAVYESSIIIPVYNKFDLTRLCLKSLAATTSREKTEVIVIDNASTDVTPKACATLGKNLFGEAFTYIRNEKNRNFAGASNQGAQCANGDYLVFLNNDTETRPGWYEPLIADFIEYANIGASGPLLLYPPDKIFGHTIQHLGVLVSPQLKFGHLYAGIPAESPLAKRRRFFQVITAACMIIPRQLFFNAGGFDEAFINGFEDVDLCGRLVKLGYRMTVNPISRVIHYESQSEGRKAHDEENFARVISKAGSLFQVDWHLHLQKDSLELDVTDDLYLRQALPDKMRKRLDPLAEKLDGEALKKMLIDFPYWERGMEAFAKTLADVDLRLKIYERLFKVNKDPQYLIKSFNTALGADKKSHAKRTKFLFDAFLEEQGNYMENINYAMEKCKMLDLANLYHKYELKAAQYDFYLRRQNYLQSMRQAMSGEL